MKSGNVSTQAEKQETRWLPHATKEKQFQWSNGDNIENLIHCLSHFKVQVEYENKDFNADKVKQYEAFREAMNSASLKISFLSLQVRFPG